MKSHEIKQIIETICSRNVKMLNGRILYYENKRDEMKRFDEKIRLALVGDLFAELKMAFGIKD